MAQTWEPFKFISGFTHRKDLKSSPCYQTWHASNTGKTNCPLPSALGEKTEKDRCWPGTFFSISGTCGCWLGILLILFLEPLDFIFANPSVGWLMIFSLRNMWGWTPQISFLQFGFSSLGTFLRGATPPGAAQGDICLVFQHAFRHSCNLQKHLSWVDCVKEIRRFNTLHCKSAVKVPLLPGRHTYLESQMLAQHSLLAFDP